MEQYESFSIADPLYELGVFRTESGKDIYTEVFGGEERFGRLYERLINSFEINRLNFLKQAGLLYLIFPSATHTRFAHSLGCFTLGTFALENMWVRKNGRLIRLDRYLQIRKLREEFLIALLVHDIGHLPFSHYLEDNELIKETYQNHEKITFDFLNEKSPLYNRLLKEAQRNESETVVEICKSLQSVDIQKIRLLLEEENEDPASQLVCGYLDLDRLDHYYRDSFFMGLKLASVNVRGFLQAIVIDDSEKPRFFLRSDGVPHVLHLLFGREMLWQRALDNDVNRSYQAMCIKALDLWLNENKDKIDEIPFMTEDILISYLRECPRSKALIDRIFSRRPYVLMFKKEDSNMSEKQVVKAYQEWLKENAYNEEDFLLFIPRNFQKEKTVMNEWLLSDIPIFEGGSLRTHHGDLFDYFQRQTAKRVKTIRIFARDDKLAESRKQSAAKIFW